MVLSKKIRDFDSKNVWYEEKVNCEADDVLKCGS
jgi:hypothetical protein